MQYMIKSLKLKESTLCICIERERVLVDLSDDTIEEDNGGVVEALNGVVSCQFEMILQARKRRARHYRNNGSRVSSQCLSLLESRKIQLRFSNDYDL